MRVDAERRVIFPPVNTELKPSDLLGQMIERESPRRVVYVSAPLTTAGAGRAIKDQWEDAPIDRVYRTLSLNGRVVENIIASVQDTLLEDGDKLVLPHQIGRWGWREMGFMEFWTGYILGYPPETATEISREFERSQSQEADSYKAIGSYIADRLKRNDFPTNPVKGMVFLPDHRISAGCSLERKIALAAQIPAREVVFDYNYPDFKNNATVTFYGGG